MPPSLLTCPNEVLDMIFKLLLVHPHPICPEQIETRSNKFRCIDVYAGNRFNDDIIYGTSHEQSEVTRDLLSLNLVCRKFNRALRAHPIFYKENVFSFQDVNQFILFSAAITPNRRAAIQHLRLHDLVDITPLSYHYTFGISPPDHSYNFPHEKVLVLLTQFKNIKEFSWIFLNFYVPTAKSWWLDSLDVLVEVILDAAREPLADDKPSLLNLPFMRLMVDFRDSWQDTDLEDPVKALEDDVVQLGSLDEIQLGLWRQPNCRSHHYRRTKELVTSLNEEMIPRVNAIQQGTLEIPQWFKSLGKGAHRMIDSQPLDITGDARRYPVGLISDRPRSFSRLNPPAGRQAPNDIVDGLLVHNFHKVKDIRWWDKGEAVICVVEFNDDNAEVVPLHTIFSYDNIRKLQDFYHAKAGITSHEPADMQLQDRQQIPSPQDLVNIGDMELRVYAIQENLPKVNDLAGRWEKVIDKWDRMMAKLKSVVEREKEENSLPREEKAAR